MLNKSMQTLDACGGSLVKGLGVRGYCTNVIVTQNLTSRTQLQIRSSENFGDSKHVAPLFKTIQVISRDCHFGGKCKTAARTQLQRQRQQAAVKVRGEV
jgi:hypothetical protein